MTRPRRFRLVPRALLAVWALAVGLWSSPAPAQTPAAAPLDAASWAGQLDTLVRWVEQHRGPQACTAHCYALDRLRLTGSLDPGPVQFELEGSVLASGPVEVPLFGPPDKVRLDAVTEGGQPAAVSFDNGHYFVVTAARRFVIRGTLAMVNDLALNIPGPLNALEANLTGARLVEGTHLAGLTDATVHFDRGAAEPAAAGPTVFQLSHAVRIGREIGFTTRLVLQSGNDLGVVRLPMSNGERVLNVAGSTGWRMDGTDLLLPTAGRSADVTITGTLAAVRSFTPDARSDYEWWLLESDAEHRVSVAGDSRQMDSSESPIPRSEASARLFLVQRGHHIDVTVQTLTSVEALAAVVHRHDRTVVLTRHGDLVSDDTVTYENNGIDYLLYGPQGAPIFLATDGAAERIMHRDHDTAQILVPLRTGRHTARIQAQNRASLGFLGGTLEIPTPTYPLRASRATLTLGLPSFVIPVALLRGDEDWWAFSVGDGVAVTLAFAAAWLTLRTRARRLLGGVVLAGLWCVAPGIFSALLIAGAAGSAWWLMGRLFRGGTRTLVRGFVLASGLGLAFSVVVGGTAARSMAPASQPAMLRDAEEGRAQDQGVATQNAPLAGSTSEVQRYMSNRREIAGSDVGNFAAQGALGGVLQGVTPVALTLPGYARAVTVSRELVTGQRPFRPVLVYVTAWALLPAGLLWIGLLALLLGIHRDELAALRARLRARMDRPEPQPPVPAPSPSPAA